MFWRKKKNSTSLIDSLREELEEPEDIREGVVERNRSHSHDVWIPHITLENNNN